FNRSYAIGGRIAPNSRAMRYWRCFERCEKHTRAALSTETESQRAARLGQNPSGLADIASAITLLCARQEMPRQIARSARPLQPAPIMTGHLWARRSGEVATTDCNSRAPGLAAAGFACGRVTVA